MPDEACQLLGLGPEADGRTIEDTYWRLARQLAQQRDTDPAAGEQLERVNWAYRTLMDRQRGPSTSRVGDPPRWRRLFAFVGVALFVAVAGLVGWLGFRQDIEDATARGFAEAHDGWNETIEWLQSLDAEPTPQPSDSAAR